MGRFCIDRHNRAINLCYADGRATPVKLEELWSQRWHAKYKFGYQKIVIP